MSTQRILITGGTVLIGPALTGRFAPADVLVVDGRIEHIGTDISAADAEVIDATGTFVLPGFVDAHAHLWEASLRGISADWDIIDFAWAIRFNHAGLHAPEDLYAGAHAGALASLESGTTTVLDHMHAVSSPDHADEALRAVRDAGVRAVWAYGLTDVPGSTGFSSAEQRHADARRLRAELPDGGRVTMGLAVNDLLNVPWNATAGEFRLARDLDG